MNNYYVYIMTNRSGTLYTGVTNDLLRRVHEHKHGIGSKFTSKYRTTRLVYFEDYEQAIEAIEREKQIKGMLRKKKVELIQAINPTWEDLSSDWYDE